MQAIGRIRLTTELLPIQWNRSVQRLQQQGDFNLEEY